MSDKTENLRFVMYRQLEAMRKARKQPAALQDFENKLEDYLVGLSVDHTSLVASLQNTLQVYQDAYEQQKTLTRNACEFDRNRWDELYQVRADLKTAQYDRELWHDKAHEATAKLAQGTESIKALHRVIKDQQTAQDRLQEAVDRLTATHNSNAARHADELEQWATNYDEQWDANQVKQKLIVEQREAIKTLVFELANARKAAVKPSFWSFLARKKHQAKPLPKKTN